MKSRTLSLFAILYACIWLFTACDSPSKDSSANLVTIQVSGGPDILNPMISRLSVSSEIESLLYLPLAFWDYTEDRWVPVLLEKFEPEKNEADDTEYRLQVRPEAAWSDGQPLTEEDLEFTLKLSLNPYLESQSWATYVDLIDTVFYSSGNLILLMATPYILADEFIAGFIPLPKHVLDPTGILDDFSFSRLKSGRDFTMEEKAVLKKLGERASSYGKMERWPEVVSGLFRLEEWSPDRYLSLQRRQDFWGENLPELQENIHTNIERIQYLFIPDAQNALNAFTSHHVDVIQTLADKDTSVVQRAGGKNYPVPTRQLIYISVNHRNSLLSQLKIRKALNLGIDREDLNRKLFSGRGQIATGPIHPDKFYFLETEESYDPENAKEILIDAGCKDIDGDGILECPSRSGEREPLHFEIWTTRSPLSGQVAALLKSYWKRIGVDLTIKSADFKTFLPELQDKTFDMAALMLKQNNILDDPFPLWHSSQAGSTGKNYQGMDDEKIDRILEDIRESVTLQLQKENYFRLQRLFEETVPVFFLVAPDEVIGASDHIELYRIPERPGYDLYRSNIKP